VELRVVCPVCGLLPYWLCLEVCGGWGVTEGQLKKKVRFMVVLLRYKLACLVEGLYVELLEG
jgi:hypothetical protein